VYDGGQIWKLFLYSYVAWYYTTFDFSYTTYNLLRKLKRRIILIFRHCFFSVAGLVASCRFSDLVQCMMGVNSHVYGGGQMSVWAQPFSTYHGNICSAHVVFMPTWMPKRPHNVDLTKDEDCDMLSYGACNPFHLQNFTEAPGGAGGSYLWACGACCVPHHFVNCVCCSGLAASSKFGARGSNQHFHWTWKLCVYGYVDEYYTTYNCIVIDYTTYKWSDVTCKCLVRLNDIWYYKILYDKYFLLCDT